MKRLALLILILTHLTFKASAQQPQVQIKAIMQLVGDATIKGDYATVIAYTHPKFVTKAGGKDSLLKIMEKLYGQLKNRGITLKSYQAERPGEIMQVGDRSFSIVPETLIMKVDGGTLTAKSSMVAISEDQGKHWYLISSGSVASGSLFEMFPEADGKIAIPKFGKPMFTPDNKQ